MSIFVLTLWNIEEEEGNDFYFSNLEKATSFISDNFSWDKPRKITSENFEGKINQYIIKEYVINQERI